MCVFVSACPRVSLFVVPQYIACHLPGGRENRFVLPRVAAAETLRELCENNREHHRYNRWCCQISQPGLSSQTSDRRRASQGQNGTKQDMTREDKTSQCQGQENKKM